MGNNISSQPPQLPEGDRTGQLMAGALEKLQGSFFVVGKTRVRSSIAWISIGAAAGLVLGITWVVNRSGQFQPTVASVARSEARMPRYKPGELIVKLKEKPLKSAASAAGVKGGKSEGVTTGHLSLDKLYKKFEVKSARKILERHEKLLEQANDEEKAAVEETGVDRLTLVEVPENTNIQSAIRELRNDPNVEYAEPNYLAEFSVLPNDPSFPKLWGMNNTGQTGGVADADIDAPEAWNTQTAANFVVVAVIDSGVDYTHEDLAANIWSNTGEIPGNGIDDDKNGFIDDIRGWDFVNNDNNPFDDFGHGTHAAGTIGAVGNNGKGVVGAAWSVKILPLKFLDSGGGGSYEAAIAAIQYATLKRVSIMSNSWGGGGYSQALKDVIKTAEKSGILFVAAAGNSSSDSDINPMYPAAYDNENIVSVAATDDKDGKAGFSNYGKISVDLGAPGVNIYSTVPTSTCSLCDPSGYKYLNGTSMATPHVSGVAALIKARYWPTFAGVKARLMWNSDPVPSMQGTTVSGGRLNASRVFESDYTAPAKIFDLSMADKSLYSITLKWSAVGDNGSSGTASAYDIRYSKTPISDGSVFNNAAKVGNAPKPKTPGSSETLVVENLDHSTAYYFAMKAVDNVGNAGYMSNLIVATTEQPVVIYSDKFESGPNGWLTSIYPGFANLWHLENAKSYSPGTSWTYNSGPTNYNYDNGSSNGGYLLSPPIDLPLVGSVWFDFFEYYETEGDLEFFELRRVEVSENGGPFNILTQNPGNPMRTWYKHSVNLLPYAGKTIQVRFYFHAFDSLYNNFWGWSIDNFSILTEKTDLIVSQIAPQASYLTSGRPVSLLNAVKNQGGVSAGSFEVGFSLSRDAIYGNADDVKFAETRLVSSLASGSEASAATQLTVSSTTPLGSYYLCASADIKNSVFESKEQNNNSCTATTTPLYTPVSVSVDSNINVPMKYGTDTSISKVVSVNQDAGIPPRNVSFSYSITDGIPAPMAVTFSPASCAAPCSTNMTITNKAPYVAGNWKLTVYGSYDTFQEKTTSTITVNPPACTAGRTSPPIGGFFDVTDKGSCNFTAWSKSVNPLSSLWYWYVDGITAYPGGSPKPYLSPNGSPPPTLPVPLPGGVQWNGRHDFRVYEPYIGTVTCAQQYVTGCP